ncbi:MAG: hypothetical protein E6G56_12725 [Actinobacteria bacterium]|nr:MAG: hypothetical protein E6G56_12725 [Actinomycetota bacterium]
MEEPSPHRDEAEELLRAALLDSDTAVAVAMRVRGLSLCDALTIIFHGRRDLGTIQTYVAHGGRGAGDSVASDELLRVPCDLDLADAEDRQDAEQLYAEQARSLRDALLAADTVLAVWRQPLSELVGASVAVDRSIELEVDLPAPRLMPVALVAPDRQLMVAPVCGPRTLAEGRPPMGIACAQRDICHVYPLPEDPERCLEDFFGRAADHARALAERLAHQEASVDRFLELSDEDRL